MSDAFEQRWFDDLPIVGILRGFESDSVHPIVRAAARGGLRNIEITMNSPNAEDLIRQVTEAVGDRMNVGAGTVLNKRHISAALDAGARFIVTPVVNETVVRRCVELRIPVFPGAFTPTEVVRAWEMGATMVKIFPADQLGPSYIRKLKATSPHVRLMPTGGVSLESLVSFVRAGANAAGVGSPLFHPGRVRQKDWTWIESRCQAFAECWRNAAKFD